MDNQRQKDPRLLQLPEGRGFSFAGLWARNDKLGVTSCTIITAPADQHIAHIHMRLPAILDQSSYGEWLDTDFQGKDAKVMLIDRQIGDELVFHRVGREVNSPLYDGTDTKPLVNSL